MVTLPPILEFTRLYPHARPPERFDDNSIGWDVFAYLLTESGRATSRAIQTQGVTSVPTGIRLRPPEGYYVQISSRYSLACKGLFIPNAPVMIPTGFDGELTILLVNTSYQVQYVAHEHRVAHLILQPILTFRVRELQTTQHKEDVHPGPGQGHH